jgi:hypothetical protein
MTELKPCNRCKSPLPPESFGVDNSRKDRKNRHCKHCCRDFTNSKRARERVAPKIIAVDTRDHIRSLSDTDRILYALRNGRRTWDELKGDTILNENDLSDATAVLRDEGKITIRSEGEERVYSLRYVA